MTIQKTFCLDILNTGEYFIATGLPPAPEANHRRFILEVAGSQLTALTTTGKPSLPVRKSRHGEKGTINAGPSLQLFPKPENCMSFVIGESWRRSVDKAAHPALIALINTMQEAVPTPTARRVLADA